MFEVGGSHYDPCIGVIRGGLNPDIIFSLSMNVYIIAELVKEDHKTTYVMNGPYTNAGMIMCKQYLDRYPEKLSELAEQYEVSKIRPIVHKVYVC